MKYCPFCGKELGWRVHKCPHCGRLIATDTVRTDLPTAQQDRSYEPYLKQRYRMSRIKSVFYGILWAFVAFVGILLLNNIDIFRSDKAQVNEMAKPLLQEIFDSELSSAEIKVLETNAIKIDRSSNEYDGIALVRINGDEIYIGFHAIYDGEDVIISVPHDEMLKLMLF